MASFFVFFFFQAEDGIRDGRVTGVQTCALPICGDPESPSNLCAIRHVFPKSAEIASERSSRFSSALLNTSSNGPSASNALPIAAFGFGNAVLAGGLQWTPPSAVRTIRIRFGGSPA